MPNKLILILLLQWFNQNIAAPQDLENKIKKLESEKSELFKQINDAIDDSVISLKKSNNNDSQLGISYIQDLKKQIKDLNETEPIDKVNENEDVIFDNKSDFENRRMEGTIEINTEKYAHKLVDPLERRPFLKDIAEAEKRKAKIELAYFGAMKDKSKKWRQKYEARLNIQQKLDKWIEKRETEKQKIREIKQKKMIYKEKCPNYGLENQKNNKKSKRGRNAKKISGKSYPCCRKCCKKSYLGCLKKK